MRHVLLGLAALLFLTTATAADAGMLRASWYGPGFYDKPMANGRPFDGNPRIVANRTMPLGTVLKITNPANGRTLVGIVQDRGPYCKRRHYQACPLQLDLPEASARMLGYYDQGIALLEVQEIRRIETS